MFLFVHYFYLITSTCPDSSILTEYQTQFEDLDLVITGCFFYRTTNYVGAIAMATALEYVQGIGIENIENYEKQLLEYANKKLSSISELIIYGNAKNKACVISFLIDTVHHYDTGMILDKLGIAVRTGTHCTEPLMKRLRIDGTVRASMAFYNTFEEIDVLCSGIERVKTMFF